MTPLLLGIRIGNGMNVLYCLRTGSRAGPTLGSDLQLEPDPQSIKGDQSIYHSQRGEEGVDKKAVMALMLNKGGEVGEGGGDSIILSMLCGRNHL